MSKPAQGHQTPENEIEQIADALSTIESLSPVLTEQHASVPLPSHEVLEKIINELKEVLLPGYFGRFNAETLSEDICARLQTIRIHLSQEIFRGMVFADPALKKDLKATRNLSYRLTCEFINALPSIRRMLFGDAQAAYEGDPAATSVGETIFCYPSMVTMIHHRIAHKLYELSVPIIPRMISEVAHSSTGIDIHPGAQIGENFFIDHGTGVVIGETCIIGKGCRLYQGVTLGALSFKKNDDGSLVKGIPRHPILEDNVTVYAGASILGRITIGSGSVIGGNVWLTHSVPAMSRIVQNSAKKSATSPLQGKAS